MSNTTLDLSTIYLLKANSLFGLANYSSALEFYRKIDNISLNGERNTGIAMCYQKLGLYNESQEQYTEALKNNSRIPETYFNFAVLRLEQNNNNAAKKLLEECLKINKNFHEARKLLQDIQSPGASDWYKWWFGDGLKKRIFGGFLTSFIMFSVILANVIILANLTVENKFISQEEILGFSLTVGLLFLLLLLPSIKRMKYKDFEVEISLFALYIELPDLIPPKGLDLELSRQDTYGNIR